MPKRKEVFEALQFFAIQAVSYCLITFNYRAIAQASAANAVGSDLLFASMSFFVIRKIARTESSVISWLGYSAGSGVGTLAGIVISKWWLGK